MNTIQSNVANFDRSTFGRYRCEVHRYLMRRLCQPQDVDDLAQEVYLRLLRLDDETCVQKPLAYLYGIASHVLANYRMEAERQRTRVEFSSDEADDWAEHPACVLPDDLAERLNLQQQIDAAMAELTPRQREVILLHKRDGLSIDEIAAVLRISPETVDKHVIGAKTRIRTRLWDR